MPHDKPSFGGSSATYYSYMGRWSRVLAPLFLDWLEVGLGKQWIDIGCGTGELSQSIIAKCDPAELQGIDPAETYVNYAGIQNPFGKFSVGDATKLTYPGNRFDVAVSGLVLNFVPDNQAAIREMVRIVRPGGIVASYVWDYAGHMQIMRYFFDTARDFDSASMEYDDGIRAPICRPKPLEAAFSKAGLKDVKVEAIDIPTPFENFDEYWQPFLGGTGSAPQYCMLLDEPLRIRIRDALKNKLPTGPDGEILLAARAWAVKGFKPS